LKKSTDAVKSVDWANLVMDFHLDALLNLPNVTVFICYQEQNFIILKLQFLNEGTVCPHCQTYTDDINQTRTIFFGAGFSYLWARSLSTSSPATILLSSLLKILYRTFRVDGDGAKVHPKI
jgi:hypothetical protein